LPEKSKFFKKFSVKIEFFVKLPEKKSKFLWNLAGKIEILLTQIHDSPDFKPD